MSRLALPALVLSLLPAVAAAGDPGPTCRQELAEVDRSSFQALVGFLTAGATAEKCAALAAHIDATARARDVHLRCLSAGADRDQIVAGLSATIVDFRQVQMQLGCRVGASLTWPRTADG
jgi:hypothetical protein